MFIMKDEGVFIGICIFEYLEAAYRCTMFIMKDEGVFIGICIFEYL